MGGGNIRKVLQERWGIGEEFDQQVCDWMIKATKWLAWELAPLS